MEESLNVAKQLKDEFLIGRNLNNLGLTHHRQGNYEVALDYYLKSLVISERIGDATGALTHK
jgi:tetratricopeptide (TPR) repeat protein